MTSHRTAEVLSTFERMCAAHGAVDPQPCYSDLRATDEAVLLFVRKLRRLHPEAYADVIGRVGPEIRDALTMADNRADVVRAHDKAAGIVRQFISPWADDCLSE